MKCKYCNTTFLPKRPWQKFCSPEHKDAFHSEERRDVSALRERLRALEAELSKLKGER